MYSSSNDVRHAAVAVVLRPHPAIGNATEILFIKRAERDGDPWSGHMAFPGGHVEPDDESQQAAASRETMEEIGLNLQPARYLGSFDYQTAMPRSDRRDMVVTPHVWALEEIDPAFRPNYEVDEVVWASLPELLSGELHGKQPWQVSGQSMHFDGYTLKTGHFVWGLTYKMLKTFFAIVDPEWQEPK